MAILEQGMLTVSVGVYNFLLFAGLIAAAMLAGKLVTWTSKNILKKFAAKTKTKADDLLVSVLEGPIIFTVFIISLYFARGILDLSARWSSLLDKALIILVIVNAAWYLLRFLDGVIEHYLRPLTAKTETELDGHLLPVIRRILSILIVLIAAIILVDRLGFNVSGLVAGLGIGGLAFALAAQDLLGNFFGGLAIITDKPFKVGDRVKIGTDVDGFVREIGLRTTRIETFGGTMIVIPNRKIADTILEDVSTEKKRRRLITLNLEYGTSVQKLELAKKLVIKNIKNVDGLDHDVYSVTFSAFGPSSLDLNVIFWITKKGIDRYWDVHDELFTGIKRDFEKAKIQFAYPTQTVHVRK